MGAKKSAPFPLLKEEEEEGEVSSEGLAEDTDELLFRRLTEGDGYTVSNYRWSPDGKMVVFGHAPDPRAESWNKSDLSIVDVATSSRPDSAAGPAIARPNSWLHRLSP